MRVEYINPFIEAARAVFKTLLDTEATGGKVYLKASPFSVSDTIIMIGVVGEIRGQVCLELSFETVQKIVATMVGGIPVVDMDEIASSAIGELGNMIMGNTCTIFSREKIKNDITPPTILTGNRIKISNKTTTIVIPLMLQNFGNININITAEEML